MALLPFLIASAFFDTSRSAKIFLPPFSGPSPGLFPPFIAEYFIISAAGTSIYATRVPATPPYPLFTVANLGVVRCYSLWGFSVLPVLRLSGGFQIRCLSRFASSGSHLDSQYEDSLRSFLPFISLWVHTHNGPWHSLCPPRVPLLCLRTAGESAGAGGVSPPSPPPPSLPPLPMESLG